MKNILYTLFIVALFSCKTQQVHSQYNIGNLTPFIGTWEYKTGNQIFRVKIYEDKLYLKGDYELVEVNNGLETKLYVSDYYAPNSDIHWGYAIFGGSNDGVKMGARITDNSIYYEQGITNRNRKDGSLGFTIQPKSCSTCPIKAHWRINKLSGIIFTDTPKDFNIPTDIIMTKVQASILPKD